MTDVCIDEKALGRLLGNTRKLMGMDGIETYHIDEWAAQEAEEVLDDD